MRSCDQVTIRGKRILHNMLLISATLTNAIILLMYKIVLQNILHGTVHICPRMHAMSDMCYPNSRVKDFYDICHYEY